MLIVNISIKEYNEISKYKDLEIRIENMWHLKTTTVPVVVGALSMIKKGTDKYISKILASSSLYEIQNTALGVTTHHLRSLRSI